MAVVLRKKFDLISLLPKLESHTVWESLLVPLAAAAASSMYLIALTNTQQTQHGVRQRPVPDDQPGRVRRDRRGTRSSATATAKTSRSPGW